MVSCKTRTCILIKQYYFEKDCSICKEFQKWMINQDLEHIHRMIEVAQEPGQSWSIMDYLKLVPGPVFITDPGVSTRNPIEILHKKMLVLSSQRVELVLLSYNLYNLGLGQGHCYISCLERTSN